MQVLYDIVLFNIITIIPSFIILIFFLQIMFLFQILI